RIRASPRPRRAHHPSCAARAAILAAAGPATATRAGGPRGAAADLDRRLSVGGRRNGRGASHAADATDGLADRLGDRSSAAARSHTTRAHARTAETGGGALGRPRPTG